MLEIPDDKFAVDLRRFTEWVRRRDRQRDEANVSNVVDQLYPDRLVLVGD